MQDQQGRSTVTQPAFDPAAFAAFMQQQAPQQPPAVQFPQHQPGYPAVPQGYAPQMPQGYAPQQPQQPVPAPVGGTLDDFFSQPSSGWGPALSFKDKPIGTTYVGIVAREVTNGDISQQTQPGSNAPMFYKDGRPKLVMKVALSVQPDQAFPEGKGQWYVQGQARDELARAMSEAGAPAGPPEVGAAIAVTLSGKTDNNFGTKTNQFTVKYQRPEGAAPAAPAPVEQPAAAPAPVAPQVPAQPAPPAAEAPAGLPADKAALLAQLTGQPAS
jgi:hypothetical protein